MAFLYVSAVKTQIATLVRQNKGFYWPLLLFLGIGLAVLGLVDKTHSFLFFNRWHHPLADAVFPTLTHFGDGLMGLALIVLLLFINYRLAISATACFFSVLFLTQLGKLVLFADVLRPAGHFRELGIPIRLVDGVEMHYNNSFPSGHSAGAFALYSFIALALPNKSLGFPLFVVALLAAFSRIYLAQHFFNDVVVGSAIGACCTLLIYSFMEYRYFSQSRPWHRRGLLRR